MKTKILFLTISILTAISLVLAKVDLSVRKLNIEDIKNNVLKYEKQGYQFNLLYAYFTKKNIPEDVQYLIKDYKPDKFWGVSMTKIKNNCKYLKLKKDIKFILITKTKDYLELIYFPDNTATYRGKLEIGYIFEQITKPEQAIEYAQILLNEHRPLNPIDYQKFIVKSKNQYLKIKNALIKQFGKNNKNLKILNENPKVYGINAKKIDIGFKVSALIYYENKILEYSLIVTKYNLFAEKENYFIVNTMPVGNMINAPVTAFESDNYKFAQDMQDCIQKNLIKGEYENLGGKDFFKYEKDEGKIKLFDLTN